jgi:hypothetical protein
MLEKLRFGPVVGWRGRRVFRGCGLRLAPGAFGLGAILLGLLVGALAGQSGRTF